MKLNLPLVTGKQLRLSSSNIKNAPVLKAPFLKVCEKWDYENHVILDCPVRVYSISRLPQPSIYSEFLIGFRVNVPSKPQFHLLSLWLQPDIMPFGLRQQNQFLTLPKIRIAF